MGSKKPQRIPALPPETALQCPLERGAAALLGSNMGGLILGQGLRQIKRHKRHIVSNSAVAARLMRNEMSTEQEELWALALSSSKTLVEQRLIFRGTVNSCLVHPRDIFRFLCCANASCFILGHNHPSGQRNPSYEDWQFTRRIVVCAATFEIPFLDHIIVTRTSHTSLASLNPVAFVSEGNPCLNLEP